MSKDILDTMREYAQYAEINTERKAFEDVIAEVERLREENDAWKMDGSSCANEVLRLRAEVEKLREVCNDGYCSLVAENEQLKWACAAKDVDNMRMRDILRRLREDAHAALGGKDNQS